jgi:PAS domain S-box-containing protein
MNTKKNKSDAASLRKKAEEQLKNRQTESKESFSEGKMLNLIHELQVHQVELEMQNEELLLAKEQEELAREKYTSLFEFAPSAYFTLTELGNIAELNLAGAQMLGKERQKLINNRLAFFIGSNSRVVFDDFVTQVFSSKSPASLEVTFGTKEDSCIYALLTGTLSDDGKHCLITVTDISDRKKRELGLRKTAELNYLLLALFANATALTDKQLYDEALDIAVKITGSAIGFFHQVSEDQQEILLTTWNDEARKNCTTVYDNHYPIDKAGNWADCVRQKKPVVYNDYAGSPNRKGMPAGHAPVGRTMSVPVVHKEKVTLIFGVGNKTSDYTDSDVTFIQSIANELDKILGKRAIERNLQQIEDRWHFAIEGSNDGIWDWNVLTGDVHFSNRWKEMIGFEPHEIGEKLEEWEKRVHPDDMPAVQETLQRHFNGESPQYLTEHRILCKDGSWKWIQDRGKVLQWTPEGKPMRMVGTHTDITGRKLAEEQIIGQNTLINGILNATPNFLVLKNTDGTYREVNAVFCNFLDKTRQEIIGKSDRELFPPPEAEEYIKGDKEVISSGISENRDWLVTGGKEMRWLNVIKNAVRNSSGEVTGVLCSVTDITERKQTENILAFLAQTSFTPAQDDFFQVLAQYISESLGMGFVCIDRLDGDNLTAHTVAVYSNGKFEDNVSYALQDTPCGEVVGKQVCYFPSSIKNLFPNDEVLQQMEAESYIGVTLWSHDGRPIGLIAVIGEQPITNRTQAESLLKLVAVRAAGEMERKMAENQLRESEEFNRRLLATIPDFVIRTDIEGNIVYSNEPTGKDSLFLSKEQLLGRNMLSFVHETDLERAVENTRRMFEKPLGAQEYKLMTHDGQVLECEVNGDLVRDGDNNPVGMVYVVRNISERKLMEKVLSQSKLRLDKAEEIGSTGSWDYDLESDSLAWSDHTYRIYGESKESFIPTFGKVIAHYPDAEREEVVAAFNRAIAEQSEFRIDHRIITKSGEIRFVQEIGRLILSANGMPVRMAGSVVDITGRKLAELALQESEKKYRSIFESVKEVYFEASMDGTLLEVSPSINYITKGQYTRDEMIGQSFVDIYANAGQRDIYFSQLIKQKILNDYELLLSNKDGSIIPVAISSALSFDAGGKPLKIIGILRDISERKTAETAIKERDAKFRTLFDTMAEGVIYQDNTGAIIHANPASERILGVSLDQLQGRASIDPRWNSIHEDGSPFPGNTHPAMIALATGKENTAVMGVFNPSIEKYMWIIVNAIPEFRNGEDKPFQVFTTFRDISELKNAFDQINKAKEDLEFKVEERTKELREINIFQKAILDNAPFAILSTDTNGIFQSINPAGEAMTGYTAGEVIGKLTPLGFHDREEIFRFCTEATGNPVPKEEDAYAAAMEAMFHKITEWHWIRKDGKRFPVKISHSSLVGADGIVNGYMGLILDISKEKEYLDALQESEERFHKMFKEHAAVMLLINPENGDIIQANDTAVAYYGLDFLNTTRNIRDINVFSPSKIKDEMEMAARQHRNYFIFPHKLATGEIRTVEVHSTPIEVSGNTLLFSIIHDITERKQTENALKKSEAENRAIIQAVPDMMFRIHRDGIYLDYHGKNDSSLYVSKEFFIGKKLSEVLPPELAAESMQAIGKAFDSGEVVQYEYSLPVNGKNCFFENRIIGISDEEVLSIIRDITYRKETETALKMQIAAFESFALAIIITDIAGRIQWANSAFSRLTGYPVEEATGKMPGELVKSGKQDRTFYENFWNTILDKKVWSGELINKRKDGSLYYEEETITPVLDSLGNISSFIAIKIDVTERKKLYQALADEKRRLADIIKGTNAGTWEWNIQSGETIFNEQWAQMLGYTLEEISPVSMETWIKFAHPDDLKTSGELLNKHFKGELAYYSFESRMKNKNGEWIWVLDRGRVHEWDTDGKPLLMSGIHQDITEQKRIESALQQAKNEAEKANLAKSEFLSRMSHELRTPMNSILGFAQLMEMGELNPKQKKGVTHILNNGKHLLDLINEVLDISGIEAGRQTMMPEPVQLANAINEITDSIQVAASKRKISIEFADSPANSHFVLADKLRLKQVLINLLSNAIKYNKQGGSITIQTKLQPVNEQGNALVRISITDTGIGITPEEAGKLFQPFERIGADKTETEGTGLGLMIVKKITEAMGGTVGVESEAGVGSTFWIELPQAENLNDEAIQSIGTTSPVLQVTNTASTILYIEDNRSNIELIEEVFAEHRPEILLVTSKFGKKTIELAKKHKPGLILLDLDLPDLNGIEVLAQLLADEHTKSIPVIIISADAMSFQIDKLMKAGATGYLTKPLDVVLFLRTIEQHTAI